MPEDVSHLYSFSTLHGGLQEDKTYKICISSAYFACISPIGKIFENFLQFLLDICRTDCYNSSCSQALHN